MNDVIVRLKLDPESKKVLAALEDAAEAWEVRLRRERRYLWLNAALTTIWIGALICHWLLELSL